LIEEGEVHDVSHEGTPDRNEEISVKDSAYDAYETRKYLKGQGPFVSFLKQFWWAILIPILIGIALLIIEYEFFVE
jgi:hypothetical protein